jgi:antirestriction protein
MANITLYELSNYNNSQLMPRTFDLDGIDTHEEWLVAIHKWMQALTRETNHLCEEWIVCDYEDIPASYVGEHDIDPHYWGYKQVVEGSYLGADVFEAAAELDIEPGIVEELYQGEYDNDEDFAYQMADGLGLVPEGYSWPTSCIDWTAAARDLMMDYGVSGGHYFRTSY